MKHFGKTFSAIALSCAALLVTFAPEVSQAESFGVTNQCLTTDDIRGWPTNSPPSTTGFLTGTWVDVRNIESALLTFSSLCPTNATNSGLTVRLVRSWSDSSPQVLSYTNGLWTKTFEDPEFSPLLFSAPSNNFLATGHATNLPYTWTTNISSSQLGGCNWLGIYSVTSPCPAMWLTNVGVDISKKILPRRFP